MCTCPSQNVFRSWQWTLNMFPKSFINSIKKNGTEKHFASQWLSTSLLSMIGFKFHVETPFFNIFINVYLGKGHIHTINRHSGCDVICYGQFMKGVWSILLLQYDKCFLMNWEKCRGGFRGGTPSVCPLYFCSDRASDFVWVPQAKRMHQIMRTDFENYNFSLLLRGAHPLQTTPVPTGTKNLSVLNLGAPLLKNPESAPDMGHIGCSSNTINIKYFKWDNYNFKEKEILWFFPCFPYTHITISINTELQHFPLEK